MKNINITLEDKTVEELKTYAMAMGITTEEFIEDVILEFVRFQAAEMDELYFNDDGTHWLVPRD